MIKTRDQINELSASIDDFIKMMYSTGSTVINATKGNFEALVEEDFPELFDYVKQNFVSLSNREAVEQLLSEYRDSFEDYEEIKLTLAIEPEEKLIQKILDWFSKNIPDTFDYVLEIEKKKNILGGTLISFRGSYTDFSLEKKLDKYFENTTLDYAFE